MLEIYKKVIVDARTESVCIQFLLQTSKVYLFAPSKKKVKMVFHGVYENNTRLRSTKAPPRC